MTPGAMKVNGRAWKARSAAGAAFACASCRLVRGGAGEEVVAIGFRLPVQTPDDMAGYLLLALREAGKMGFRLQFVADRKVRARVIGSTRYINTRSASWVEIGLTLYGARVAADGGEY